jgi:3-methyladenine DNA glycosylase/8-oxoguanine DNA glycosylase
VAGASTLAGRLAGALGTPLPPARAHGLACAFPAPAALAEAGLGGIGLTSARAAAVGAFAAAVADGRVALAREADLDALVDTLVAVPGIGPWTAHYIALRLGLPDAFPATDLGLRRSFAVRAPAGAPELARYAERWRPWRAYAAAHLWLAAAG